MALFGAPSSSNKLLSFKAGRMNLREKTVIADKRKGLVSMEYGTVDRLLMLKWSDRATGTVELVRLWPVLTITNSMRIRILCSSQFWSKSDSISHL